MKRLAGEYEKATGLDPKKEHGKWNIVGKTLLGAGIPLIIQAGGDLDEISASGPPSWLLPGSSSTAMPGIVRFVAMVDPTAPVGLTPGKA